MSQTPETSELKEAKIARAIREALAEHKIEVASMSFQNDIHFDKEHITFWVWVFFKKSDKIEAMHVFRSKELSEDEVIKRLMQKFSDKGLLTPKTA
jgi:hypoxanthine phosphoribosyltransferase